MKKQLLLALVAITALATSCQKNTVGYFNNSQAVSYKEAKKEAKIATQAIVTENIDEQIVTASSEESITSTSVLEKAIVDNNVVVNETKQMVFAGQKISSKEEFLTLTPAKIKESTGKSLTFKEKIVLKATQKQLKKNNTVGSDDKSHVAAILLSFFLGGLGIHRFYLGYTWQGVVQLLTLGGLGIWALIDFVRIIIKDLEPKDGSYN
jgi:TM2 domain-containing membrane protein YozV